MRKERVSLRGRMVRDMMKNMMDSAMGHKFQTGEYRANPVEPGWICPADYDYEIIELGDCKMEYLRPSGIFTGRVILQLHGGGYIGPMKNAYRDFAMQYSKRSFGGDVLTVDYRVAPEHPFPAALGDAVAAYGWLLEERRYSSEKIIIAGDSAGGGLALALVLYLRDHNLPLPGGMILMSPWADLTCSGDSHIYNFDKDPQFGGTKDNMLYNNPYVGDWDPKHPYISPVFGSYEGFPPVLLQAGGDEVLLSDTLTIAEKLRKNHRKVRLTVYDGMFHVFQMAMRLIPESREAWDEAGRFMEIIYGIRRKKEGQNVRVVKSGEKKSSRRKKSGGKSRQEQQTG